jgi:flagellar motor switch protein FliM
MNKTLFIQNKLERPVSQNDRYFIVKINTEIENKIIEGEVGWINPYFDIKEFEGKAPKNCKVISCRECKTKQEYYKWKRTPF